MGSFPWFSERKFGIIMHYGLYSVLERGEWVMNEECIPVHEYEKLADKFTAEHFDARAIAARAREAGAGYLILTSRHHDGFCLFDSAVSDFNSVRLGPKRDLIAEHVKACRAEGLKVGIYYSLLDWRYRGYHDRINYPESLEKMVNQAHAQVRELLTNYGLIDYLWFDGGWFPDQLDNCFQESTRQEMARLWRADELFRMIRELQPGVMLNNRSGLPGDVITPEQHTEKDTRYSFSEACMTCGDRWGWGYFRNNPAKTPYTILQYLVEQCSFGGNFLLNLAPCPDGTIRIDEDAILSALGRWFRVNGSSIYGTGSTPSLLHSMIGLVTARDDTLYYHIFRWPDCGEAVLSGLADEVESVCFLENGQALPFVQENSGRLVIRGLPHLAPDPLDTVLVICLSGNRLSLPEDLQQIGIL